MLIIDWTSPFFVIAKREKANIASWMKVGNDEDGATQGARNVEVPKFEIIDLTTDSEDQPAST